MTSLSERWDALCDQLDSAVEAWQQHYRIDAAQREAAYGRVVAIGDSMRAFIDESSDASELPRGREGLSA